MESVLSKFYGVKRSEGVPSMFNSIFFKLKRERIFVYNKEYYKNVRSIL